MADSALYDTLSYEGYEVDEVQVRNPSGTINNTTNVPVFVSSTFMDLQVYRRKIQDALTQLEAIVRGMEQFGSKPGSPVEECLKVVQSCQLYIGIFGMRYGSVPEGHDKSMTHIEYDEAQKLGLPSLIYILNENQPIPPKDVETGIGAEKLGALKDQLKKRHTVSFFTTPEDLHARIMHDVPTQLESMGVEVASGLVKAEEVSDRDALRDFELLPKPRDLEGKSEAQTKHDRDVVNLRWFFRRMSVDLLGMHISEMPGRLHYFAPVMHDGLSAILRNPSFRLYDNALEKSLRGLVSELGKTLAHDGHYRELNSLWVQAFGMRGLHVDYNAERAVAAEIQESAASLAHTLDLVIEVVRNNYIEVDLDDLTRVCGA